MVDRSIKFLNFVEIIYKRIGTKQSECKLKITHKVVSERYKHISPSIICDDGDIFDLLSLHDDQKEINLYVTLEPKKDKVKTICVAADDDVSNFDDTC